MAILPYDRSPSRLPVWLGAGGITVLVVLGIVAMGLPLRCNLGLTWDNSCPAGSAGATTMRGGAVAPQPSGVAAPARPAKPQNLVSATFGRLGNAATRPQAVAVPPPAAVASVAAPAGKASELATRVVKTVTVGPDGAVVGAPTSPSPVEPVPLAAAPTADSLASATPSLDAQRAEPAASADAPPLPLPPLTAGAAAPASEATPAPVADAGPKAAAQAPASGGSERVVGGSGVTVRSAPGHNGGRLFALSSGEHVTVSGTQRGWLHVTNAKGQTGWAYSSFFKR